MTITRATMASPIAISSSSSSQIPLLYRRRRLYTAISGMPLSASLIILLMYFCSISAAWNVTIDVEAQINSSPEFRLLAAQGVILTDPDANLVKRGDSSSSSASSSTSTSTALAISSTTTALSSLPSAFDTALGNNYTSTACPDYINSFLENSTFKECEPISLMLQNSNSFFEATKSLTELSVTLDMACAVDRESCNTLMLSLAAQLIEDANCGQDYRDENPIVLEAYAGLVAYEPVYNATCITSPATGDYCFADAITNATNPSDAYPYYTALGIQLPGGVDLTCDKCLQDTMAIYALAAANSSQPVSSTYVDTAEIIDVSCGPTFVNTTVPTSRGMQMTASPESYFIPLLTTIVMLIAI